MHQRNVSAHTASNEPSQHQTTSKSLAYCQYEILQEIQGDTTTYGFSDVLNSNSELIESTLRGSAPSPSHELSPSLSFRTFNWTL